MYATVATNACIFHAQNTVVHGTHGHFMFNTMYLATHRYIHPQHPLFMFLSGTMRGAYPVIQQTGDVAFGHAGLTGTYFTMQGIADGDDFVTCWQASDFVRDTPVFNGTPCTSQQAYEIELLDIIKTTCDAMVEEIFHDDAALQADPEITEWFEVLRMKIPSMHEKLTMMSLKHILYRFHATVVLHDMTHEVKHAPLNVGDTTKHGEILSLFPSKYEVLIQAYLYKAFDSQRETGLPFGFFWADLFQQDVHYQALLDTATSDLDRLHQKYDGDDVLHVRSTIMM
jgi:hypothetical protein